MSMALWIAGCAVIQIFQRRKFITGENKKDQQKKIGLIPAVADRAYSVQRESIRDPYIVGEMHLSYTSNDPPRLQ